MNIDVMFLARIWTLKLTVLEEVKQRKRRKQRVRLSQFRTGAESYKNKNQFKRVFRADKLKLEYSEVDNTTKAVASQSKRFGYNGESLISWIEDNSLNQNEIDPNAIFWLKLLCR